MRPPSPRQVLLKSRWLAHAAAQCYQHNSQAISMAAGFGCAPAQLRIQRVVRGDTRCLIVGTPTDIICAFRGTVVSDLRSVHRDLQTEMVPEGPCLVHQGFRDALDSIWPFLVTIIGDWQTSHRRALWFTGHSLGGALATIAAVRAVSRLIDGGHEGFRPAGLVTFGAPRCGDRFFGGAVDWIRQSHAVVARFTNSNDPVPRVPPLMDGYRHGVPELYLSASGAIWADPSLLRRLWDALCERWRTRTTILSAHSIDTYHERLQSYRFDRLPKGML